MKGEGTLWSFPDLRPDREELDGSPAAQSARPVPGGPWQAAGTTHAGSGSAAAGAVAGTSVGADTAGASRLAGTAGWPGAGRPAAQEGHPGPDDRPAPADGGGLAGHGRRPDRN